MISDINGNYNCCNYGYTSSDTALELTLILEGRGQSKKGDEQKPTGYYQLSNHVFAIGGHDIWTGSLYVKERISSSFQKVHSDNKPTLVGIFFLPILKTVYSSTYFSIFMSFTSKNKSCLIPCSFANTKFPPIAQQNTSFSPLIAQQNSNTNMGIQLSVHTTWAHYWTADSLREEKSRCGQWSLKVLHRDKRSIKTVAEKNSEEKKRCLIGQLHWFISSPMLSFERWVLYLVPCEKH